MLGGGVLDPDLTGLAAALTEVTLMRSLLVLLPPQQLLMR